MMAFAAEITAPARAALPRDQSQATAVSIIGAHGLIVMHRCQLDEIGRCNSLEECSRCLFAVLTGVESLGPIYGVTAPLVPDQQYGCAKRHALRPVAIKAICELPGIRSLCLGQTTLQDDSLATIGRIRSLEDLDVGGTDVTDEGLRLLRGLDHLEWLRLRETRITDRGMAYLGRLNSLKYLDLSGCDVTDNGVKELKHLPSLKLLRLTGTNITTQGRTALRASLPNVGFDFQ